MSPKNADMIDLKAETLIPLREVPKHQPKRPNGRPLHVSAVYRWVQRGVRGTKLEAIKLGGTTYTSVEALQRFAEGRSDPHAGRSGGPPTTAQRKNQIERASRRVDEILGR